MLSAKRNFISEACAFLTDKQVGKRELWKKLVDQFRFRTDKTGYYKGEYWGKIMRGAALICKYTKDDELYNVLEETVRDMLSVCAEDGITSHRKGSEFTGWDLWCRKYVAVGLEYFYDICRSEELKAEILRVLKIHLLAICEKIGDGEGKKGICDASRDWGGLNSCSILKSYVVAYKLTGEQRLLDFASYIVSTGGSKDFNFIQAALKGDPLCTYRYPKAYEATSFFEGVLEYGKLTGDEKLLTACVSYARSILKEEFTVVGSGACATECYNYSVATQTNARKLPVQETCVTVSILLYFSEIYKLTGETVYLDAMEKSFYNAYLGALNENAPNRTHGLPIDWYSPLVGGHRSNIVRAGMQIFSDGSIYSCCTAIGPAGVGVFASDEVEVEKNKVCFRFYGDRIVDLDRCRITEKTEYPRSEKIVFSFSGAEEKLDLSFRIPSWCEDFSISLNGKTLSAKNINGFVSVSELLKNGDEIVLFLRMSYVPTYMASARFLGGFLYFSKGPIVYAADRRFSKLFTAFPLLSLHKPKFDFSYEKGSDPRCLDKVTVSYHSKKITLIDYASAGSTYSAASRLNVFVPYRTRSPRSVLVCFFDRRTYI